MKRLILSVACCVLVLAAGFQILHANPAQIECPVSLSNPDGQALVLEKYHLRVAAHGPLSLTEAEMVFRNPENRVMEGRFLYTLPTGATISRFAKEVDGKLMEGEVVERLRAQSIYTQILHTMRDPALLEMDQGNRFSARVFPIPANGSVRLVLSYSQLTKVEKGERKLTIPLAGMPQIGEFKFTAMMRKAPGEAFDKNLLLEQAQLTDGDELAAVNHLANNYKPAKDIEISFKLNEGIAPVRAIKSAHYQMLTYRPMLAASSAEPQKNEFVFYFDTSASNADMEAAKIDAIEKLMVSFNEAKPAAFGFDVNVAPLYPAPELMSKLDTGGYAALMATQLRRRHFLGATNLEKTLKHLVAQAAERKEAQTFVLVSDGIATLGAREAGEIAKLLEGFPENDTLHALTIGSKQDEKMLNAIVEKTRGRVLTLPLTDRFESKIPAILADLRAPLGASFEFYDEGAEWIFPRTFRDVRPGAELVVFSELKPGAPAKPGVLQRGANGKVVQDKALDIAATEVPDFAPLLQREASAALLNHLEKMEQAEQNAGRKDEIRKQRLSVSVKSRVLCPLTSLLVLETENDYRRFGIERTALAQIMQIGANGIELRKRAPDEVPAPRADDPARKPGTGQRPGDARQEVHKAKADRAPQADEKLSEARFGGADKGGAEVEGRERRRGRAAFDDGGEAAGELLNERTAGGRGVNAFAAPDANGADGRPRADADDRPVNALRQQPGEPAATAAAPRSETPGAPPPPAQSQPRVADNKKGGGRPAWTTQFDAPPTDAELELLRTQVAGNPKNRNLRNLYSDALFKARKWDSLQGEAFQWLPFDPENPQVYEFLGKSATGLNDPSTALRAMTSIAEIAPNRAALLSRAGYLLLTAKQFEMAEEMFREALKNRPDEANIVRGLAMSLWLGGKFDKAGETLEKALDQDFHGRYGDVKRVLREELGYIYRLWMKKDAAQADAVKQRAAKFGVKLDEADAVRVTLAWETDANDVDLHVVDPSGEECYYSHKQNASGLELYSDQTQGLGPEVIRTKKAQPGQYYAGVNYFSAGAMGVSRGIIVVFQPVDGVDENPQIVPFCLMPGGHNMRLLAAVTVK